jgi:DNA-binding transcriptional regulator YiaG
LNEEEWRPVTDYESYYEISSLGRVRRSPESPKIGMAVPGAILSLRGRVDNRGYPQTQLYRNGKATTRKIHRMVADAFLGPRAPGLQVNHKDGIKSNNTVANLEYVTNRENAHHAIRLGLIDVEKIARLGRACAGVGRKLNAVDVAKIRHMAGAGASRKSLAREFGVHEMTIGEIIRREIWRSVA